MRTNAHSADHELAVSMASSAGLELFWSTVAAGCALIGIVSAHAVTMSAAATIAIAFAMLARSGELAARWPRDDSRAPAREAVGVNLIVALAALAFGALALAGVYSFAFTLLGVLMLAGLLVLDAPLEPELAAPRGAVAGGFMVLAGLSAIIMVTATFTARAGEPTLVPWSALFVAVAHLVASGALLLRFGRSALH